MSRPRKLFSWLGTAGVAVVMLLGGALVWWNVFGQGEHGAACRFSLGCRSFYCLHHALRGDAQVVAGGACTKACTGDGECGGAERCVVLSPEAREDLPPFGKPERACMQTSGRLER